MNQTLIRIVMVDEQRLLTNALALRIHQEEGLRVVGIATDDEEGLAMARVLKPNVFTIDIHSRGRGCFEVAERLGETQPETGVLLLMGNVSSSLLNQALQCRKIRGCVDKRESPEKFIDALRCAANDEFFISQSFRERLVYDSQERRLRVANEISVAKMTARQMEVLRHLANGRSVKEIARVMHLSEKSVDSHKYRIMTRLRIHDRVGLARFAIREGLVQP